MRNFVIFLYTALALTIVGCTSEKVSQRLIHLEKLQSQVDSANTVFISIQMDSIQAYKRHSETQLDFIKQHFWDTSNRENAQYIDVYYANFKKMRKLVKGYPRVQAEIENSQKQLSSLYHDTKHQIHADSVYERYVSGEEKMVRSIVESVGRLKSWEEQSVNRYHGMVDPIDSVILSLKEQGYR